MYILKNKIMKNLSLIALYLAFFTVSLLVYLLYIGQDLVIPLVMAFLIASMISALNNTIKKVRYISYISMPLSFALIIFVLYLLWTLVVNNISELGNNLWNYISRIEEITYSVFDLFKIDKPENFSHYFKDINYTPIINSILSSVTSLLSNAGLILFFVIFLLLEWRHFEHKMSKMFSNKARHEKTTMILNKIQKDIRSYFVIKALLSLLTAVASYVIMKIFWLNFAEFFAIVVFILNFIPNIGSIIAVTFPVLLSIVQFGNLLTFIWLAVLLVSVQFIVWNLIEPKYMWNRLNLSPLVIIISLTFWGLLWWPTGMILSVPITVVINIILSNIKSTRSIAVMLSEKWDI